MRLWVERLRWGLVAAALLLIAVLAVLLGYSRYRAVKAWRQIVARSGATITHEAHEVTYSQAVGGRTVFTIHAADALPHGDGKYTLRDVVLLLYGSNGKRVDRISGAEFEYDEKNQVARALGEVHMDLQAPAGLSAGHDEHPSSIPPPSLPGGEVAESPQTIHVRTSGLVYMRKLGVAATDQAVEIAYEGVQGYAKGAEFDSAQSVVHLLADVRMDGSLRGNGIHLTAGKADLERDTDLVRLTAPRVQSAAGSRAREAQAENAVVHLRQDGSVERVEAAGDVSLRSGTQSLTAASLNAAMSQRSLLQEAEFAGPVQMDDRNPARPMHGTAHSLTVRCDQDGQPRTAVAQGHVSLAAEDRSTTGERLHRALAAETVVLTLRRGADARSTEPSAIQATGAASARAEAMGGRSERGEAGLRTTELVGDTLRLEFAGMGSNRAAPQVLTGSGHTRLTQIGADGAQEISTGDSLLAHFAASGEPASRTSGQWSGLQVASAEQSGHVALHLQPAAAHGTTAAVSSDASADRLAYDGAADRITLTGHPIVRRGGTSVSAGTMVLSEASGDTEAQGGVSGTFVGENAALGSPVTHVTAQQATLRRAAQTAEFRGTDAQPARMWQGASQIEAARLVLNRADDRLAARPSGEGGLVHAVFAGRNAAGPSGGSGPTRGGRPDLTGDLVRVSSAALDYSGASGEAVFTGGVRAEAAGARVQGSRAVAFLNAPQPANAHGPAPSRARPDSAPQSALAGRIEKIVVSGDVRLEEPGREGTGDQLLYTAATQQFVLTGSPGHRPRISDENQGNITGATLLFGAADSTIVVAGEAGAHGQNRGRVHSETVLKP